MAVHRVRFQILVMIGLVAGLASASAGGVNLGNDDDDNNTDAGPAFFGFVRDAGGAAVGDAKVTATLKAGGALVTLQQCHGRV